MPSLLRRVAEIGSADDDSDLVRLRKKVLNLAAFLIAVISPLWSTLYLLLGLELSAAIPLVYCLVTFPFLWLCSRFQLYRWFRIVEMTMMITFPFILQMSLGGFANGSVVAVWALAAPLGAVFFFSARQATPWFLVFVALIVVSGLLDPRISDDAPSIPEAVIVGSFVLNLLAVSTTVFLLVQYSVRAREIEHDRSERLLLNVLPESVARRLKDSEGVIADAYPEATVLFADIVGFTPLSDQLDPDELVALLDRVFTYWDDLASEYQLEKIKTVGDEYMVVGGVPDPRAGSRRGRSGHGPENVCPAGGRFVGSPLPATGPDRDRLRSGNRRCDRPLQVHLRHLGGHGKHRQPDGIKWRARADSGDGPNPGAAW